jgi:flagellar protein FlaH
VIWLAREIAAPPKPIPTGIEELDIKLGGGIPFPSFILIEGDHGSGKTSLSFLIADALLRAGHRILYISTESSTKEVINKATGIKIDSIRKAFMRGRMMIHSVHLAGSKWDEIVGIRALKILINYFSSMEDRYDSFILDSASILFSYASRDTINDFLTRVRNEVNRSKCVVITLHTRSIDEQLAIRLRATSDVYLLMGLAEYGGKAYKVMNVKKIHGAETRAESSIVFDIDPNIGFRVVPLSLAIA